MTLILVLFLIFQSKINALDVNTTTTTSPPSPSPTTSTESSSTTTETPLTTQKPPTSSEPERKDRFIDTDYDFCPCDLTVNTCDINFCCDETDCSNQDRNLFSFYEKIRRPPRSEDYFCSSEKLIYINNSRHMIKQKRHGLFCIVRSNRPSVDVYLDRRIIGSISEYRKTLAIDEKWTWADEREQPLKIEASHIFRFGDALWLTLITVNELKIIEHWKLPASLITTGGFCDSFEAVKFLTPLKDSCLRRVQTLSTTCEDDSFFSSLTFYANIFVLKTAPINQVLFGHENKNNSANKRNRRDISPNCLEFGDCGI